MEASYYNVIADMHDGTYALYNTHYCSLLLLDEGERSLLDDLGKTAKTNPDFMKALVDGHFALENPESEADDLFDEYERYKHNDHYFELTICPTLDCNFRCPYCYERKRPGHMTAEVQNCLMRFVEESFAERPFEKMRIVWYGGEPLLQPEIIESLSKRFVSFCDGHGLEYQASLMTNGYLATPEMMERMRACRITSVQVTFGGKGEHHEANRPAVSGKPTYELVYENTVAMIDAGFFTHIEFVVDRDNYDSCLELAAELGPRENVFFETPFRKADFNGDLFEEDNGELVPQFNYINSREHDEFFFSYFMCTKPTSKNFESRLVPVHHCCGYSMDRFFVIDELGNAYKCIVDVDKPDTHALFNICEPSETRWLNHDLIEFAKNENPLHNPNCRSCRIYPLCNGGCPPDRSERCGVVDSSLESSYKLFLFTIEDFVREYTAALKREKAALKREKAALKWEKALTT